MSYIRSRLNEYIELDLQIESIHSPRLVEAMRYAVLGGGKRLRGCLVCATATGLGSALQTALPVAASVEYIHAYSLVHDDLPDMDDAEMRRGKPSCHKAFGPTMAILTGDALQALAFSSVATCNDLTDSQRVSCIAILGDASGWKNMVGGQAMDMELEGKEIDEEEVLSKLNDAKTGALFRACTELGAILAGQEQESKHFRLLSKFGRRLGAAFQITDDVLDVTASADELGKPIAADVASGKHNLVSHLGVEGARNKASKMLANALTILEELRLQSSVLAEIANLSVNRAS
ncbi:MAG: polyprenyl synthetase family protein [Gammaproteobacteria bacterium]|nr:polyprenyl synthetase family protein [Gammaproteobacteria bacterium]